ncbi:MAG: hypothetical protein U5L45_11775 [Saprospiraceae bacterium]|nr:hypothetical protein [Saprospiraceae bacterium]
MRSCDRYCAVGQKDKAFALFDKAFAVVCREFSKNRQFSSAGSEWRKKGNPKSHRYARRALTTSEQIGNTHLKNDIISEIARNFSQAKDHERAEVLSKNIQDPYFLVEGLIRTAKNHIKVKNIEKAYELLNFSTEK